ncbi:hypothetical protein CHARACLAT_009708 [Characodon lateralis]|uniref:Uncharacterized protein n=1 Tax=Characodon lateralis TaxID=208331 RepID=A0ABU7DZE3_9TELE|nr:hypothetical protein [Characodon lateralis]
MPFLVFQRVPDPIHSNKIPIAFAFAREKGPQYHRCSTITNSGHEVLFQTYSSFASYKTTWSAVEKFNLGLIRPKNTVPDKVQKAFCKLHRFIFVMVKEKTPKQPIVR